MTVFSRTRVQGRTAGCSKIISEADVAQLVEQLIRNQQVIGSSPIVGSIVLEQALAKTILWRPASRTSVLALLADKNPSIPTVELHG
jgi:hypothetical protein